MEVLEGRDPEFFGMVKPLMDKAMGAGALDQKTKTLIILFLDAIRGQHDAVKAVAARARAVGATDGEITEVIRLAFITSGLSGMVAGLAAFQE